LAKAQSKNWHNRITKYMQCLRNLNYRDTYAMYTYITTPFWYMSLLDPVSLA